MQFMNKLFVVLPSVIVFWGLSYLIMIRSKKVKVGNGLAFIFLVVTAAFMAWLDGRGLNDAFLTPLIICVLSCLVLRALGEPQKTTVVQPNAEKTEG